MSTSRIHVCTADFYYLFIILDYDLRTSIENHSGIGFTLHKSRSRRYPAVTITDADYAYDDVLFAYLCCDAETLV